MTASNPFDISGLEFAADAISEALANVTTYTPEDFPNYDEEYVSIKTRLELNDNGTVTLSYHDVPILDLEQLLEEQGSVEGITATLSHVANLMSNSIMARVKALGADEETMAAWLAAINLVADFA